MLVEVDLIRQLKEKDARAFGWLYSAYAPAIYGLILKLTPDARLAAIILERSFLNFWQQIEAFDLEKDKLFTWMVRITIKQCKSVSRLPKEIVRQKLDKIPSEKVC